MQNPGSASNKNLLPKMEACLMGCEERRGISGGEGIAPTQGLNLKASSIPFHKIEKRILRSVLAFFLVFF